MKIVAILLFIFASAGIYAQSLVISTLPNCWLAMPESDSAQTMIENLAANYEQQLEEMQVELNKKYDDYLTIVIVIQI